MKLLVFLSLLLPSLCFSATNGEVISIEQQEYSNNKDTVYKIKYYSAGRRLTTVAIVPISTPPINGFPLLVWTHGTTGLDPKCAPSNRTPVYPTSGRYKKYITVIPDYNYQPHSYYTSVHDATAVLDAIRAIQSFSGDVSMDVNNIIIAGNSQGGHVLLKTLEINDQYASEIAFKQAIAFSPGSNALGHLQNMANYYVTHNGHPEVYLVAVMFYAVARYEGHLEEYDRIFQPGKDYRYVKNKCLGELFASQDKFLFTEDFSQRALSYDWDGTVWSRWFKRREGGNFYTNTPITIVNGTNDILTGYQETLELIDRLRAYGNRVWHLPQQGVGHNMVDEPAVQDQFSSSINYWFYN